MVGHTIPYLYQKRGVYYFSRRVPGDLLGHYRQSKIVFSIRTKSLKAARVKSASLAAQLNEDWLTIRWRSKDTPLRKFLRDQATEAGFESTAPMMSEAGQIYLRTKGAGRPLTFGTAVDVVLATISRGDILGEMSLIDNKPRMASARAVGEVALTLITR